MLEGTRTDPGPPRRDYTVTVITSDIRNAGTDADVFIDIKGKGTNAYSPPQFSLYNLTCCRSLFTQLQAAT